MSWWSSPYRRRWVLWGLLAVTFLLVNVYRLSTAVIADELMSTLGTTGGQLGTLHAMFFIVYGLMQFPTGVLVDRIGPRLTAAGGAVMMNLGAIGFALTSTYWSALIARFFIGLGASVIFVSMLRFCANWYRSDEFATMSGMSFAVGGVGGILATTPFALLVDGLGWRVSVLALGGIGVIIGISTFLFLRDSPERAGLDPIPGVSEQRRLTVTQIRRFSSIVLTDRWTWVVSIVLFCTGGVNLTLFGLWGIPYVVQTYDTTVTVASIFTLMGGVGAVIGPPSIGWIADRIGYRFELLVGGGVLYPLLLLIIAILGDPPVVIVGVTFLLIGALLGTFVLTFPLIKERHDERASGIALGTINGAAFFGAAAFPTAMGWVLDAYWTGETVGGVRVYSLTGYRMAFTLAALAGSVAFVCTLWLYYRRHHIGSNGDSIGGEVVR